MGIKLINKNNDLELKAPIMYGLDKTLTKEGFGADAKAVGDAIAAINVTGGGASAIVDSAQGNSITVKDSAKDKIRDFAIDGKTEQKTTTGKNVFDLSKVKTINSASTGAKVEINNTGIRMKNVWAEEIVNNENVQKILEPNTRYTISLKVKIVSKPDVTLNTDNSILILYDSTNLANVIGMAFPTEKNNWVEGQTYTYTTNFTTKDLSNAKILAYCYFDTDTKKAVGEIEITELMIRKATVTDATYEPYTGGVASPNPNYPQDINNAGRYNEETGRYEVGVEVGNKNLLKYPYVNTTKTANGITFTDNGDGSITTDGTAEADAFFVMKRNVDLGKNAINAIVTPSGASNGLYALSYRIYYNNNTKDISINILKGTTISNETVYPQLEKGTVATPYIPHESKKVTLTSSRELTKWDKLEKRNGVYGWVYKGVKYVLDGSMWLTYDNFNGFTLPNRLSEKLNMREGYCNQATVIPYNANGNMAPSNGLWIGVSNNTTLYLVNNDFFDATLEDKGLANFKAHLNENPLIIYTYTDTEIFEPLQEAEQAALEELETYYGVTNITNSEGCNMKLTYSADTKLYIDKKIAEVATALVAIGG